MQIDTKRFGENLHNIRKAFGETQAELAEAIYVSDSTISNYEKGIRFPDPEILVLIANHYLISVDEITTIYTHPITKLTFDPFIIWNDIDIVFPIIVNENVLNNEHFFRANEIHSSLFNEIKKTYKCDFGDRFIIALEEYDVASENENLMAECAANSISIIFFIRLISQLTSSVFEINPEIMHLPIVKQYLSKKNISISQEQIVAFLNSAKEISSLFVSKDFRTTYAKWKRILKNSKHLGDLADYYIALEYYFGFVGRRIDITASYRIKMKMMKEYASMGNQYCKDFLSLENKTVCTKE